MDISSTVVMQSRVSSSSMTLGSASSSGCAMITGPRGAESTGANALGRSLCPLLADTCASRATRGGLRRLGRRPRSLVCAGRWCRTVGSKTGSFQGKKISSWIIHCPQPTRARPVRLQEARHRHVRRPHGHLYGAQWRNQSARLGGRSSGPSLPLSWSHRPHSTSSDGQRRPPPRRRGDPRVSARCRWQPELGLRPVRR